MLKRYVIACILCIVVLSAWQVARSQSMISGGPFQFQVPGTHAACTVIAGATEFCFAGDGLWESIAGAPYAQVLPGGVTSVNGKTGALTISVTVQ